MHLLRNLSVIAVGCAVGLGITEAGLRLVGFSRPFFYTKDFLRGSSLRPGAEGWVQTEGEAYVRVNSDGLRDREHAIAKPPRTLRIAILGDSFAEAFQLPVDKTFWTVLGDRLQACPAVAGRQVEIINFGVGGYGTAQELITLRHFAWKYTPDIVLLAFFTGNDLRNNLRELNNREPIPYFVYKGNRLVLDDSFSEPLRAYAAPGATRRRRWFYSLVNRSRVIQLANWIRVLLKNGALQNGAVQHRPPQNPFIRMASNEKSAFEGKEIGLDEEVFFPPKDAPWREAWHVTEGILRLMRDDVHQHDAQFWIVTLSTGLQVYPDRSVRQSFLHQHGLENLFYPDLRIRAFAEREQIRVVTLAPEMAKYSESHQLFLHGFHKPLLGFGHWNETGHRIAGEIIASQMCSGLRRDATTRLVHR